MTFFHCVWLCVEKGVFRKGSGDFSFAEVLPCEQLAPGLLHNPPEN